MKPLRKPEDEAAAELARELFQPLGEISVRAMFGGAGVKADDKMFALIDEGELYLKADAVLAERLNAMGSRQFTYPAKDGELMAMNYWRLPDAAADDFELAVELGRAALALAGVKPKPKKKA